MEGEETQTETTDETPKLIDEDTKLADAAAGGNTYEGVDRTPEPATPTATPGGSAGGGQGAQPNGGGNAPIDLDAELNAKELLIDKYGAGLISPEEYAKQAAVHEKNILKAQRELAKPAQQVQQTIKQQEAAQAYWQQWGKGKDVAQLTFGKTVKPDRAAALFREATAEVSANPRYQNRPEMDPEAIAYDKWMDKLEAEAKKKPATASASTPQTRVTGDTPVSQSGVQTGPRKTAKQKLADGEYGLLD